MSKHQWVLFLAIFTAQGVVFGQSDRFELLKSQREDAVKRALDPIDKKYVFELKKLKNVLVKSGDLDGAIKIEEELKKFDSSKPEKKLPPKKELSLAYLKQTAWKNVRGGGTAVWKFSDESFEAYAVDEKGRIESEPLSKSGFKIIDPDTRTIQIMWNTGNALHTFDSDFTIITGNGKIFQIIKLE